MQFIKYKRHEVLNMDEGQHWIKHNIEYKLRAGGKVMLESLYCPVH